MHQMLTWCIYACIKSESFISHSTIAVAWTVWLQRNDRCFARACKPLGAVVGDVWNMVDLWCGAGLVDRSRLVTM
jgi:hypothetical protein